MPLTSKLEVNCANRNLADAMPEILATYRKFGGVICKGLLSAKDLSVIHQATAALVGTQVRRAQEENPDWGFAGQDPKQFESGIMELEALNHKYVGKVYDYINSHTAVFHYASHPAITQVADCLVNGAATNELLAHGFLYRIDVPGNQSELLGWHRDYDYVRGSQRAVTLWLPVHDIDAEMGAVTLIPRPYTLTDVESKQVEKKWPNRKPHLTWELQNVEQLEAYPERLQAEVKAGDALFFSTLAAHKSEYNNSKKARCTLQVRFQPAGDPAMLTMDASAIKLR